MATVWIVPAGTDSAPEAGSGDHLLRRAGDLYEVGRLEGGCTWVGSVSAGLLPDLPDVDGPTRAPDQEAALRAVLGVESAEDARGA